MDMWSLPNPTIQPLNALNSKDIRHILQELG